MKPEFDLQAYLSGGVERMIRRALRAALTNPAQSVFLLQFAAASKRAAEKRAALERTGKHIPPFLIASISEQCNLHCAGCYARSQKSCQDAHTEQLLPTETWRRIFEESKELGISFILLAGGEPLMRRDVLLQAAAFPEILFPVFTNGTLMNGAYADLFAQRRNLLPVLSIEGDEGQTDGRRGAGVYQKLLAAMELLHSKKVMFGVSITVTTQNQPVVISDEFLNRLAALGCSVVFYVEYVPVTEDSASLAPGEAERAVMADRLAVLREAYPQLLFVSFPGDEIASQGCLAAGRGFFHINPQGAAEPCPFSPYSDCNVRDRSLSAALDSALFHKLQSGGLLTERHDGGCVLFRHKQEVAFLLAQETPAASHTVSPPDA